MKKISLMFAVAVAALGFSSCSETWDDNPVLNTHEGEEKADFLNQPQMSDQVIMLTTDNQDGTFHLTCSQPDFGYAAVATYRVQCSLTEDFAKFEEIQQDFYDCGEINPLNADVAAALEKLSGVQTEADLPLPYQRLYMRLRAYIGVEEENTQFLSNVVSFKGVSADYLAIWVSGVPVNIYLRGGFPEASDWGAIAQYQFVTGPEENTWVTGTIDIPAGTEFKVADDSWGALNAGAGAAGGTVVPDTPLVIDNGDNPGNLTMSVAFHGYAHLSLVKGVYTLTLASTAN